MSSSESTLRAVRAQVQFELAETAAAVAEAATRSANAQAHVTVATERCNCAAGELRGAMSRVQVNPPLLHAMRRLYQLEQRILQEWQERLLAAEQHEQQARTKLAGVRNRERSLERALEVERRTRQRRQQTLDGLRADDLWLQHAWRGLS